MLICVECGQDFEDMNMGVSYFICHECMIELE